MLAMNDLSVYFYGLTLAVIVGEVAVHDIFRMLTATLYAMFVENNLTLNQTNRFDSGAKPASCYYFMNACRNPKISE